MPIFKPITQIHPLYQCYRFKYHIEQYSCPNSIYMLSCSTIYITYMKFRWMNISLCVICSEAMSTISYNKRSSSIIVQLYANEGYRYNRWYIIHGKITDNMLMLTRWRCNNQIAICHTRNHCIYLNYKHDIQTINSNHLKSRLSTKVKRKFLWWTYFISGWVVWQRLSHIILAYMCESYMAIDVHWTRQRNSTSYKLK